MGGRRSQRGRLRGVRPAVGRMRGFVLGLGFWAPDQRLCPPAERSWCPKAFIVLPSVSSNLRRFSLPLRLVRASLSPICRVLALQAGFRSFSALASTRPSVRRAWWYSFPALHDGGSSGLLLWADVRCSPPAQPQALGASALVGASSVLCRQRSLSVASVYAASRVIFLMLPFLNGISFFFLSASTPFGLWLYHRTAFYL